MLISFVNKFRLRHERRREMQSEWLRKYYSKNYGIIVGMYSYGCFDEKRIPINTTIGRYCSFSTTCVLLSGNHGLNFLSLHPFLYNRTLGIVSDETIRRTQFVIEDDVWIGHNAVILPSAKKIGRGAVIGAGAVVTRNVEPYEIVGGVPARHIRFRFSNEIIDAIEKLNWWQWPLEKLIKEMRHNPDLIYQPDLFFGRNTNS